MEQIPVKRIEEVIVVAGDDKQKQKEFYECSYLLSFMLLAH